MKKVSIFLSLFVASFFLLSQNVKADTYNFIATQNSIDFYNNELNTCISSINHFLSENPTFPQNYLITSTSNNIQVLLYPDLNGVTFLKNESSFYLNDKNSTMRLYDYDIINHSLIQRSLYQKTYKKLWTDNIPIYYSRSLFIYPDSNIYNFIIDSITINFDNIQEATFLPTIYNSFNSGSPDNTPVLTTFYTTVGSKIAWLGEQFTESYIYLAILGVFILIFLIELIRRYLL